jgi:hypothetical protein
MRISVTCHCRVTRPSRDGHAFIPFLSLPGNRLGPCCGWLYNTRDNHFWPLLNFHARLSCCDTSCCSSSGLGMGGSRYGPFLCPTPLALTRTVVGHEIVATIAQIHLHPSVFPTLCSVLNYSSPNPDEPQCHLAPVATWADKFKYQMRWSASLHYINALDDHPPQSCTFPGARGWAGRQGGNVLSAIRNVTNILEQQAVPSDIGAGGHPDVLANEALKFLVHFLGDMHMPLHLAGRDRGGNSQKVRFGGRITSKHCLYQTKPSY